MKKLNSYIEDKVEEIEVDPEFVSINDNTIQILEEKKFGYTIKFNEEIVDVDDVIKIEDEEIFRIEIMGYTLDVKIEDPVVAALGASTKSTGEIYSPMAGEVSKISISVGDHVKEGDTLLVISAMKMEQKIASPVNGTIKSVEVDGKDSVKSGELLVDIEPDS